MKLEELNPRCESTGVSSFGTLGLPDHAREDDSLVAVVGLKRVDRSALVVDGDGVAFHWSPLSSFQV